MVTPTARQQVLACLGRRSSATAAQIGHALNMSAATVRYHLSILAADGRVVVSRVEVTGKRGRPDKSYRLSDKLLGENLDMLADSLLVLWRDATPVAKREQAVKALAERMSAVIGPIDDSLTPSKRLVELTDRLNALHYQARWEAGAQGPRILFAHCPYAAIIGKHPELCMMDASMLGTTMNADVEQLSKIDPELRGPALCAFLLRQHRTVPGK